MYPVWGYYPPTSYYRMPYLPEHLKMYVGNKVTLFTTEGELIKGVLEEVVDASTPTDAGYMPYGTLTILLDPPNYKFVHVSKIKWIMPA